MLSTADYEVLAAFRYTLRGFLAFSDAAAARFGIPQQQYQALLAMKTPVGRGPLAVSGLAALPLVKHHSAVGMVDRLAKLRMVRRASSPGDPRKVALRLTAKGARATASLAAIHRAELARIAPDFARYMIFLARPGRGLNPLSMHPMLNTPVKAA